MKVKCIHDKWSEIPKYELLINDTSNNKSNFHIDVGIEYTVYGMTVRNGSIWYYIADRVFSYFPRWKPSSFFEVIDVRLSRHWIYSHKKHIDYPQRHSIITFPEWANNHPDFYDKLTDGDKKEVAIFKTYKELMDLEFPSSSISEVAHLVDDEWLICPTCIDAWQCSNIRNALIKCPKCQKTLNNPRYKNEYPHIDLENNS